MTTYRLPIGHVLTVTAPDDGTVKVGQSEDASVGGVVRGSASFGPYLVERNFVVGAGGSCTITASSLSTSFDGALALNAGVPDDAARATLTVNPTGNENGLTYTARAYGTSGNRITVAYTDPGAADAGLAVTVSGNIIVVSLATNGSSTITSTAAQVKAAIEASPEANALVSVAIYAADGGVADDGSGVVTAMAAAALTGGAGTRIGQSLPGGLLIDITNGKVYRNNGTQAAPAWVMLGDAA